MLTLLALTCLGGSGPVRPPLPVTTIHYRIEQRTETRAGLSAPGDQVVTLDFRWFLSVTYGDSANGRTIRAVLDSVKQRGLNTALPAEMIDSVVGSVYRGYRDGDTHLRSLHSDVYSSLGTSVEWLVQMIHPSLPPGAKPGERWADTVRVNAGTGSATASSILVRRFELSGREEHEGHPALNVVGTSAGTLSGEFQLAGATASVEGVSSSEDSYVLDQEGLVLTATSSAVDDMTLRVPMLPEPLLNKRTTQTTVIRIP